MAITGEIGVGDLLPKLLADALIFLRPLQTTGAITAGAGQAFFDSGNHFFIIVQAYCHKITSLPFYYNGIVNILRRGARPRPTAF